MKKRNHLAQSFLPAPIATSLLTYGAFVIICYAVFLLLYDRLSFSAIYALPRLTPSEQLTVLEHLWMSMSLLVIGFWLADRTEREQSNDPSE